MKSGNQQSKEVKEHKKAKLQKPRTLTQERQKETDSHWTIGYLEAAGQPAATE